MRIASFTVTRICTFIDAHVTLEVRIFRLHNNALLGMLDFVIIKVDTLTTFTLLFISPYLSSEKYLNTTILQQTEAHLRILKGRSSLYIIIKSVSQNL